MKRVRSDIMLFLVSLQMLYTSIHAAKDHGEASAAGDENSEVLGIVPIWWVYISFVIAEGPVTSRGIGKDGLFDFRW